jgi:flavin-dependent dehydrogenase
MHKHGDPHSPETTLFGDLVLDASGRDSHAPQWLEAVGYERPERTLINAFAGYATRIYRFNQKFDWQILYAQPTAPADRRGGIITPIEGGLWHVTLIGMDHDYPPTDEAGFLEFAQTLPTNELYEVIKDAEPVSPIIGYRRAENRLYHYANMSRYLENFVPVGDSVYAFNPVYGQGMSTSALGALTLDRCLEEQARSSADLTGLAEHFQKRLAQEVIMHPWQMATGQDLNWPGTEGASGVLDPETALMQNYMGRFVLATAHNTQLLQAFYSVLHMLATPEIFFRPDLVLQVFAEFSPLAAS